MIKIRATENLRKIMKERDIMQKVMAIDLHLHKDTIYKIVTMQTASTFTAELISDYLKIDQAEIFKEI